MEPLEANERWESYAGDFAEKFAKDAPRRIGSKLLCASGPVAARFIFRPPQEAAAAAG
jgi:hypothetical protein